MVRVAADRLQQARTRAAIEPCDGERGHGAVGGNGDEIEVVEVVSAGAQSVRRAIRSLSLAKPPTVSMDCPSARARVSSQARSSGSRAERSADGWHRMSPL